MKIVKKEVYYCEFCNKRSLAKGHMGTHEKHCTANPDRKCRICDKDTHFNIRQIVEQLKTRFILEEIEKPEYEGSLTMVKDFKATWTGEPVTLTEVGNLVNECPNCMLAIIRQTKLAYHYFEGMGFETFDYKKAVREYPKSYPEYSDEYLPY